MLGIRRGNRGVFPFVRKPVSDHKHTSQKRNSILHRCWERFGGEAPLQVKNGGQHFLDVIDFAFGD